MSIDNYFEIQQDLQRELIAGEKLLWSGRPKTGLVLRSSDMLAIPFSLLWFGFAIFWESGVFYSDGPFFFMIWGIPFVLMGFYISIGRFFYDAMLRKNTVYGITNTRIIIKSGVFKPSVSSFNINTIQNLGLDEKSDGSGNVKLEADKTPFSGFNVAGWPGAKQTPQIELIQNVRNVYNLILQQQHK